MRQCRLQPPNFGFYCFSNHVFACLRFSVAHLRPTCLAFSAMTNYEKVDQIKSPADFLPRRRGERGDGPGRHVSTPAPRGDSPHDDPEESQARKVSLVAEGPPLKDLDTPDANRAPALRALDGEAINGIRGKLQDKPDECQPLEDLSNPSVYLTPVPRGTGDSHKLAPSRSRSQAKLLSAAAAIEAAAATFAAVPEVGDRSKRKTKRKHKCALA